MLAVVAAGAVAAAIVSDAAPTGTAVVDRVLVAAAVAVVAWAASAARRWTWIVLAGVALAAGAGDAWALGFAFAALALTILTAGPVRPQPAVGAVVGVLATLALLRMGDVGPLGFPVLVSAVALGPVLASGYRHAARRTRRRVRWALVAGLAFVAVAGVGYGVVLASARSDAERGLRQLDAGMAAARVGDDVAAADHLDAAADAFGEADDGLGGWLAVPARVLPVVGHNARATAEMAASAEEVARSGAVSASNADTDALTVVGGRLDLAHVRSLQAPLDDVAVSMDGAVERLTDAESPWLVAPVADRLDRVQTELADARPDVDLAADATRLVPAMFGGDEPTRWLVAFVTPVEARGRTGFMGNFAELTAVDGDVEMTRFGRASELEQGGTPAAQRTLSGPEDYVDRWARFDPAGTWRNVTMSPDFPSIGQVMTELYPQSSGQPVSGVIAVDPVGLAALLTFTGPITVPDIDTPLTPDNAADYLLRQQYLTDDRPERIDALESLAEQTFDRLTTGDLPGPRTIADTLGDAVAGGHLHAYAADPGQQALFRDIGIDGALPAVGGGDALAVVNNNAVGNKVDLYLHRSITYDATWNPDTGEVEATATVTLRNDAPAEGLPRAVIGSAIPLDDRPPPGTNRTYLSVYSPLALEGAVVDGAEAEVEEQRELDRMAYSLFLDVPPDGGTRTIELRLVGQLPPGTEYSLDVASAPLVMPDDIAVTVDVEGARPGEVLADPPMTADGTTATVTEPLAVEQRIYRVEVAD